MSNSTPAPSTDVIMVDTKRIACDGGGGALGHPRIWLYMGTDNQVQCKYCDRIFRLNPNADAH